MRDGASNEKAAKAREVRIDTLRPPGARALEALGRVFAGQDRDQAWFDADKSGVTVHLNSLNLDMFRRSVARESSACIPCGRDDEENGALARAVLEAVENIGSYGVRGKRRVFAGFDAERKVKDRGKKERKRGQHFYADEEAFPRGDNPFPADRLDSIVCADSLVALKELPDNCVDLVFTSPPYNFGLDYSRQDDDHRWERYFERLFAIFDECIRVVKFGGRIAVNVQPLFSDYIPTHHMVSRHFMDRKLIWKGEILWEKNNYNCKYTAWGSWKSPSNPYLKYTWEFIEVFAKGTMKKPGRPEDADITDEEFKKWVVSKWSIAPERRMEEYGHPAMFPEELATRILKLFSFRGDVVLDPFNGAGTTTLVARRLGRRYLGVDTSPEYCEVASARIASTPGRSFSHGEGGGARDGGSSLTIEP